MWSHGPQPCIIQWNYEPCHVGSPKMDGSWWRVPTKHGPLEKGMANCFRNLRDKAKVKSLSYVQLFATPWTVAHQAPLSMGFSRQEYWSGLPFPSPGIFLTQELNLGLLHSRQILYQMSYEGRPHVPIGHLYIFFGKISVQIFCAFFNEILFCFLTCSYIFRS